MVGWYHQPIDEGMMTMTFLLALIFALSTPCAQEDSANCTWDASTSGNGEGTSFVDIGGTAYYIFD